MNVAPLVNRERRAEVAARRHKRRLKSSRIGVIIMRGESSEMRAGESSLEIKSAASAAIGAEREQCKAARDAIVSGPSIINVYGAASLEGG